MNDEDVKRYIDIVVEKVGDQIQIIAEGHTMLAQRFDRVDARLDSIDGRLTQVELGLATLQEEVQVVKEEARTFKADVAREFGEVKAMIKLSYTELDGRLRSLEHEVGDLRTRLERLESRVLPGTLS